MKENSICVYKYNLTGKESYLDKYKSLLSTAELEKCNKKLTKSLQIKSILSQGLLKECLAESLNKKPESLIIKTQPQGKPFIPEEPTLHFNISHSRDYLVIAISYDSPLGIDLEFQDNNYKEKTIEQFMSPMEMDSYTELSQNKKCDFYFKIWTAKESLAKSLGLGLKLPMKLISVNFKPAEKFSATSNDEFHFISHEKNLHLSEPIGIFLNYFQDYTLALTTTNTNYKIKLLER